MEGAGLGVMVSPAEEPGRGRGRGRPGEETVEEDLAGLHLAGRKEEVAEGGGGGTH